MGFGIRRLTSLPTNSILAGLDPGYYDLYPERREVARASNRRRGHGNHARHVVCARHRPAASGLLHDPASRGLPNVAIGDVVRAICGRKTAVAQPLLRTSNFVHWCLTATFRASLRRPKAQSLSENIRRDYKVFGA